MSDFFRELRYAARSLKNNRGFTIVAVLTLALGLGANTAVFSVLNAVLLRPLPYHAPEQLAILWTELPTQGLREGRSAFGDIEAWRAHSTTFSDIAAGDPVRVTLFGATEAEQITVHRVTPNYFTLLGVPPSLGRTFSTGEADERQRLVVISHNFWQARFGGSRDAIGATLVIDTLPSRVIGVMPADFLDDSDAWEPHTLFPDWEALRTARGAGSWLVVARLRPGATFQQAQTEMSAIARRLDEASAGAPPRGISVMPLSLHVTGAHTRSALWMLTGAVLLVLLMAVANIAGLSLARSAGREREIAIRAALGASQRRIVRELLIESVTLAVISGLAGVAVAWAGIRVILWLRPAGLARLDDAALDSLTLGWMLALSLVSGVLIGLAPALTATTRNLKPAFQEGGRSASGGAAARRVRRVLVAAEFALAVVLLAGAGLLTRSLINVQQVDPGFRPERVLSLQLASPGFPNVAQRVDFFEAARARARAVAGVEHAAIASEFFIGGSPERTVTVDAGDRGTPERLRFRSDEITPEFFETVGARLLSGRAFNSTDGTNAPKVAIVNEEMARRLWPGRDPVGRRFKVGAPDPDNPWFTVVGVAGNMRRQSLERAPLAQMFEPLAQNPSRLVTLLVRTSRDPRQVMPAVQASVRQVTKDAPVYGVTTLEDRLGVLGAQRRFQTSLLIAFAAIALALSAVGLYGLVRYGVATRRREIGIRIAIGAEARDIVRMMLGEGLMLSAAGLAVGLAGALLLSRFLSSLVFGISATDPVTFTGVSALLTGVAWAACYLPARRAARLDPVSALKYE
jgi:putative ABC transport system permease protein